MHAVSCPRHVLTIFPPTNLIRRERAWRTRILAASCGAFPKELSTSRDGGLGLVFDRIIGVHFAAALTHAMRSSAILRFAEWYDSVLAGEDVALATMGRSARDNSALGVHIRLRDRAQGSEALLAALLHTLAWRWRTIGPQRRGNAVRRRHGHMAWPDRRSLGPFPTKRRS